MPRRSLELLAVSLSILGCEELTRGLMLQHVTPREIPLAEGLHRRDTRSLRQEQDSSCVQKWISIHLEANIYMIWYISSLQLRLWSIASS
jgi:hypothetical protein